MKLPTAILVSALAITSVGYLPSGQQVQSGVAFHPAQSLASLVRNQGVRWGKSNFRLDARTKEANISVEFFDNHDNGVNERNDRLKITYSPHSPHDVGYFFTDWGVNGLEGIDECGISIGDKKHSIGLNSKESSPVQRSAAPVLYTSLLSIVEKALLSSAVSPEEIQERIYQPITTEPVDNYFLY